MVPYYKQSMIGLVRKPGYLNWDPVCLCENSDPFAMMKSRNQHSVTKFHISVFAAFVVALLSGVLDTYLIYYFFFIRESQSDFETYNLLWFFIRILWTSRVFSCFLMFSPFVVELANKRLRRRQEENFKLILSVKRLETTDF